MLKPPSGGIACDDDGSTIFTGESMIPWHVSHAGNMFGWPGSDGVVCVMNPSLYGTPFTNITNESAKIRVVSHQSR